MQIECNDLLIMPSSWFAYHFNPFHPSVPCSLVTCCVLVLPISRVVIVFSCVFLFPHPRAPTFCACRFSRQLWQEISTSYWFEYQIVSTYPFCYLIQFSSIFVFVDVRSQFFWYILPPVSLPSLWYVFSSHFSSALHLFLFSSFIPSLSWPDLLLRRTRVSHRHLLMNRIQ